MERIRPYPVDFCCPKIRRLYTSEKSRGLGPGTYLHLVETYTLHYILADIVMKIYSIPETTF